MRGWNGVFGLGWGRWTGKVLLLILVSLGWGFVGFGDGEKKGCLEFRKDTRGRSFFEISETLVFRNCFFSFFLWWFGDMRR